MFVLEVFESADRVVCVGPNGLVNFNHFDDRCLGIEAIVFTIVGAWDWGEWEREVFGGSGGVDSAIGSIGVADFACDDAGD